MKRWRKPAASLMAVAFILSLLAHILALGSGLVSFDSIDMPEDPALRQLSATLQDMQLDMPKPPALSAPRIPGTLGVPRSEASQPVADKPKPKPKHKKAPASSAKPKPVASAVVAEAPAPDQQVAQAEASAPMANAANPARQASAPQAEVASKPADHADADSEKVVKPDERITRFPAAARMQYGLYLSGVLLGSGEMRWQRDGGNYSLITDVTPVVGPKLRYETVGSITPQGLKPESFKATRNGEPREYARFDWAAATLAYGDKEHKTEPLQRGAQDWLSLGVQLALHGKKLSDAPIQITTGKKVYRMALRPEGETDFDTGAGAIRAVVVRVRDEGELTEFWLAPDFANIPVRILRADKDKRIELRANLIELDGDTVWKQPPRQPRHQNESKR